MLKNNRKNKLLAACTLALLTNATLAKADLACESDLLFNWAEAHFQDLFPRSANTETLAPWLYRFYPESGIYAGVNSDKDVYLMGGSFGNEPFYIDKLGNLLTQAYGAVGWDCPITFTAVKLPAADSSPSMKPPNGSYLGLTPLLHFVTKDLVFGVYNHPQFTNGGMIFRSEDGGVNWSLVGDDLASLHAFAFVDEAVGYVVGSASSFGVNQYVGKTTDGGKTWTDITAKLLNSVNEIWAGIARNTMNYNVATLGEDTVFIVGRHTVYASFDGGENWLLAGGAKSRDESTKTSLHRTTLRVVDNKAYVAMYDHFEYYVADAASPEWLTLPAPWDYEAGLKLTQLTFANAERGWALVEVTATNTLELYETLNGGQNWQKVASALKSDKTALFPRSANLIYYGDVLFGTAQIGTRSGDYVLTSTDGGRSWEQNDWYGEGGWPLLYKVVDNELRVYKNLNGDYNLREYGVMD
ncbi:MAG: hypothetical protein Q8Q50_02985 [Methylobacter sp.]|nr:hypothetical protein [Methylobacter sp.]